MSRFGNTTLAMAAFGLATALAYPAAAQQAAAAPGGADRLPNGSLEKYHDNLRASELVGAAVYDDQGNSIGKINDLLLDTEGKTKSAIVSVGGFLGIASKYVEVPFDKLKVEPSRSVSTGPAAGAGQDAGGGAGVTTGAATSGSAGTPAATATSPANPGLTPGPATTQVVGQSKQYFSLVLPGVSKDSLTSMPEFKYES